jgi:hypothetical protein
MVWVMGVAVGTLFAVWIVTGVRMIRLARRTRGVPELLLGTSLLLQAGLGYPISVVSQFAGDWALLVTCVSATFSNTGMGFLYVFTARVFHDASRWAWVAVGAAAALLVVQVVGNTVSQALAATPAEKLSVIMRWGGASLALSGAAWGWAGFEALRYHALLRRRVALGLADPVVANRVLLWGLMGAVAFGCVVVDTLLLYSGIPRARDVLLPLVTAVAGLLVSACMLLAFWPPEAYLARVRGGREPART